MRRTCKASRGSVKRRVSKPSFADSPTKTEFPLAFQGVRSLIRYASAMSDAIHVCEVSSKGEATKSQPAEFDAATGANLVVDDERIIAAVRPVSGCFGIDSNWRGFSRKSLCSRGGDQ